MSNTQRTIDKLKQEYFDAITNPIERIYVDMEMLQDFRLGALLSSVTVKEEVEYIYSQLPKYNARLDLDTAKYFPVLNKTDKDLDELMLKDPMKVAMLAPWTNIYGNFLAVLSYLIINNKATLEKTKLLEVVVNSGDMDYPIQLFDRFVKSITGKYPRITFKLSHKPRYTGVRDFYSDFNMLFLYDHEKFLNNESLLDSFTTKDKFSSKIIYTLPLINKSLNLDPSEYAKALAMTRATLDLFCDFFYMVGGIPTKTS